MVALSALASELLRIGLIDPLDSSVVGDVQIVDAEVDSRAVTPGALFCCIVGRESDGHSFVEEAVRNGARAVLVSRPVPIDVPQMRVNESSMRRATAEAAAFIHGHPSREVPVIGITGTNGKTTTAAMLGAICIAAGIEPEIFGTLTGARTTPESTELQRAMRRAVDAGRRIIIMEVTSHALELDRTHCVAFRAAIFTNLGHDHLDFHGSLDAYFEAKAKLFAAGVADGLVVNRDDEHGAMLIERIEGSGRRVASYGLSDATSLSESMTHSVFSWEGIEIVLPIGGRHNVDNALAAATVARLLDIPTGEIAHGLHSLPGVPGRLQRVDVAAPFSVYVDYAHTPDSLRAVLSTARGTLSHGARLHVVFGCGGDRDQSKRPEMGRVACDLADLVVVTTDNARSEDPTEIARQVVAGAADRSRVRVVLDRRDAIVQAIGAARADDVVIVAGKGHEKGQTIGHQTLDFDDLAEAERAIKMLIGDAE